MAVLLAICCCLALAGGQWLEKTIGLSDSFGSIYPEATYFVPGSNCVYVAGEDGIIVVDAATNTRGARMDLKFPLSMVYDSHDDRLYMGSLKEDSLSVIDPATHRVVSRLQVGRYPSRLCYNPTANKVYCRTGYRGDSVAVVDCSTDSVLAHIWVGWVEDPFSTTCCNPVGNKVYATSFVTGSVAVIDGAGDTLLGSLSVGDYPTALAYNPLDNKLYCAVFEDEEIAVFDAGPDTLLRLIEVGSEPMAIGYNPVSNKIYSGNAHGDIDIIDCQTDTVLASLDPGISDPMFFLFDSVDNRVFCFPDYYNSIPAISGSDDTIAGWVELHGDAYEPDPACYSPQQNRLYIPGRGTGDVGVVDAASCKFVAAIQMRSAPLLGCYAEPEDKLYCSDDESGLLAVINCSTGSLQRRVFTPGSRLRSPVYSSGSNKLYYSASLGNGSALLAVDCSSDSLVAVLPLYFDASPAIVYNPAMNRIYWAGNLGESTVVVIDCAGDSIVREVWVRQDPCALACNPDSNRVYCVSEYRADSLYVSAIDCATDSVIGVVSIGAGYYGGPMEICYVPSRDVVVCEAPGANLVVVDGKARQLVQTIPLGGVSQFRLDRAANRLYCLLAGSDELAAIDCRDMSIEARVRLAAGPNDMSFDSVANRMWVASPDYGCISLVDGRTNRFLGLLEAGQSPGDITWVSQYHAMYAVDRGGQAILVFRDTSLAGIDGVTSLSQSRALPTVVRSVLYLGELPSSSPGPSTSCLLDISGRKVLDLRPGANDVRALSPGVYFVRPEPSAVSREPSAVTKVVVTR